MLDPLQYSFRVLCNGIKTRFRIIMIAHPGHGIRFHKRFMWRIIIPPTPVPLYYISCLLGSVCGVDFPPRLSQFPIYNMQTFHLLFPPEVDTSAIDNPVVSAHPHFLGCFSPPDTRRSLASSASRRCLSTSTCK